MYIIRRIRIGSLTRMAAVLAAFLCLPVVLIIVMISVEFSTRNIGYTTQDNEVTRALLFGGIGWFGSILLLSIITAAAAALYNWLAPYIGFLRLRIDHQSS